MKSNNFIVRAYTGLLLFLRQAGFYIRRKLGESVRMQLIVVFAVCLSLSGVTFAGINKVTVSVLKLESAYIDYSDGMKDIDEEALFIVHRFENNKYDMNNSDHRKEIEEFIQLRAKNKKIDILITDMEGQVILSAGNNKSSKVNIYEVMANAMEARIDQKEKRNRDYIGRKEYYSCYPVVFSNFKGYFIVSGMPEGEVSFVRRTIPIIPASAAIFIFIVLFLIITNRKMKYLEEISTGLFEISKGNLEYKVSIKGRDELSSLASNINHMGSELKANIEKERVAERTKNELITNVSHDLRTPLTSIMGYVSLIRDRRYDNELQLQDYLNIVFSKALKLKSLIEDLFEYTRLTGNGISLERTEVDINGFLEQIVEELVPVCERENLIFVKELPKCRIKAYIDADKMARVFDNLLMNAIRYSYKPGEIAISLADDSDSFCVCVKNKGDNISEEDLKNLFERFFRVDKARNSSAGGAGLGLSIAKSIVELHNGRIWAECEENEIKFCVSIPKSV